MTTRFANNHPSPVRRPARPRAIVARHAPGVPPRLAPGDPSPRAARRTYAGARCLVTGASSGLGRALAEHLARQSALVLLTGRSAARLGEVVESLVAEGVPRANLRVVAADLTVHDDRRRLIAEATTAFGALDVLINCAGVGAYGHFETHHPSVLRSLVDLNLIALAELTRAALPLLRLGRRPSVVNIGSVVARRGIPGRTEYTASKFAVAGFTESLRAEWAIYGIHVLLVNPGFTATEFGRNLVVDTAVYATDDRRRMTADQVAAATLVALRKRKYEVTLTAGGRLLLLLNRLVPGLIHLAFNLWSLSIHGRIHADPGPSEPT
ncbi:SDR family NAD(P)-dependent oxidoreductase [Isosphaeraceae bacterium EP7]